MNDDYVRRVTVVRVIDGDTFVCDVDLGFHVTVRMSCRLAGINAPDRGEGGYTEARGALAGLLADARSVTVCSVRADKYAGRFDAEVSTWPCGAGPTLRVNDVLVDEGFAVPWDGTGPRPLVPWPPVPPPGP